jgi:hypothetical protein
VPLTPEERALLTSEVHAVGGDLAPKGLGFGGGGIGADVSFLKADEYVDFLPPWRGEGEPLAFDDLPGNQIHEGLSRLDGRLTPQVGLRRLSPDGTLRPLDGHLQGRSLLFVHGTFSNCDSILDALSRNHPAFIQWMLDAYDGRVIAYDYPTLSQQALASAMGLSRLLSGRIQGPVDVVSHSQGGLVTRYWREVFDAERLGETRSVFVAGTLAGTSLAAPWALRRAMKAMANVAWVVAQGTKVAGAVPWFGAMAGLIALLQKSVDFLAKTPAIDAGVALVPGLSGMSKVGTNAELRELHRACHAVPDGYFAITGDFEPAQEGWAFWRRFFSRTQDGAADLLFRAPNDLVVDTEAMTRLGDGREIPRDRVHHFKAGVAHVHHTNYFEQKATVDAIRRWLTR